LWKLKNKRDLNQRKFTIERVVYTAFYSNIRFLRITQRLVFSFLLIFLILLVLCSLKLFKTKKKYFSLLIGHFFYIFSNHCCISTLSIHLFECIKTTILFKRFLDICFSLKITKKRSFKLLARTVNTHINWFFHFLLSKFELFLYSWFQ
jgi:hypothetical protein